MNDLSIAFLACFFSIALGQGWKVIKPVFHARKPKWKSLLQSGGMPSSHTAATSSLAIVVGLKEGFDSTVFAIAAMLCLLTVHDAIKVRGSINIIIKLLRSTVPQNKLDEFPYLPDTVGHNVKEVIAGFILSIFVALGVYFIFL